MSEPSGEIKNRKKRKNKSKYLNIAKKKKMNANTLDVGQRGFVVTCECNEKRALMECYNILNIINQLESKGQELTDETINNVDDDLEQELEKLKSEKPFKQVNTNLKNVLFVKLNKPDLDPIQLMNTIFSRIENDQTIDCRFISKMFPIMQTRNASKTSILEGLTEILNSEKVNQITYKIEISSRINSKLSRNELIPEIGELVKKIKPEWSVDLKNAKKIVYLDILHKIVGLSILDDYFLRNKYNLNLFCKKINENNQKDNNLDRQEERVKKESNQLKEDGKYEPVDESENGVNNDAEKGIKDEASANENDKDSKKCINEKDNVEKEDINLNDDQN